MNIISTECPVCKSNRLEQYLDCIDYTVSNEKFSISNCLSCSFKFTNPRPDNIEIGKYYKSEDYISHSNTKKGLINKLYHLVRNYSLKKKLSFINKYNGVGLMLDYGCGSGAFLNVCSRANWKAYGFEPDEDARRIASSKGIKVLSSKSELKELMAGRTFDIITLWHVLEHVTDLEETLSFFKNHISVNGRLIIAVPNYKSYDAKYYGKFWAGYDVPRHLYHFDINTISSLLSRFDFKLESTHPMKFDSYYVSMLSEKYKTGSINYLKAFVTGFKSNSMASNAFDYSSVIYVFQMEE